ncbi:MAG: hypothetical protein LBM73_01645 [Candidatus Nomurabacteria bacterium]|nr:hypothetical protein [Candidatus Nomurabacteria bacterium]
MKNDLINLDGDDLEIEYPNIVASQTEYIVSHYVIFRNYVTSLTTALACFIAIEHKSKQIPSNDYDVSEQNCANLEEVISQDMMSLPERPAYNVMLNFWAMDLKDKYQNSIIQEASVNELILARLYGFACCQQGNIRQAYMNGHNHQHRKDFMAKHKLKWYVNWIDENCPILRDLADIDWGTKRYHNCVLGVIGYLING